MASLEGCAAYMRKIDPSAETLAQVEPFFEAAKAYTAGAGVAERESDARYDLTVYMLAAYWYYQRSADNADKEARNVPRAVDALLVQMQGDES